MHELSDGVSGTSITKEWCIMSPKQILLVACLLAATLTLLCAGCVSTVPPDRAEFCGDLRSGTQVRVVHRDNDISTGTFLQIEQMPFQEYLTHWNTMGSQLPEFARLPVPGERIFFNTVLLPHEFWTGTTIGFCQEYLHVRLKGDSDIKRFHLTAITRIISSDGRVVYRGDIRKLRAANDVPLMTRMILASSGETVVIPLDHISRLEVLDRGTYQRVNIYALLSEEGRGEFSRIR